MSGWFCRAAGQNDVLHSKIAEVGRGEREQLDLLESGLFDGGQEIPAEFVVAQRAFWVHGIVMKNWRLMIILK